MPRISINDIGKFPKKFQEQINSQIAVRPTNNKQSPSDGVETKKVSARFNRPVTISYHSKRNRLTDTDGAFTKYVTDSLVDCKILQDDGPKEIPSSPRKTQELVKGPEETILTIEEI